MNCVKLERNPNCEGLILWYYYDTTRTKLSANTNETMSHRRSSILTILPESCLSNKMFVGND